MQNRYQNNKDESLFKEVIKTNPLSIIIFYLIVYIFGTFLASIIVCAVVGANNGLSITEAFQIGLASSTPETNTNIYYEIQAYTNLWAYILMFVVVVFIGRDYLKEDFSVFKNYKKVLLFILFAILFAAFNYGISALGQYLVSKVSNESTSANESLLNNMILSGHAIPVGISVILLAPLTEELVYRKSMMEITNKLHPLLQILLSALIFALPHMLSSIGYNALAFIILFITYFLAGLALALIYYFSKKNIYSSLLAHTFSNVFAFIQML